MSESFQLPSAWALASMSELAEINPRSFCPLPNAAMEPVHFIPMSAVTEEFGGIDVSTRRLLGEVQKGYTSFLADDVLFAKITPCMENGKLAVVPLLQDQVAYGSTEFHVLRARGGVQPHWLAFFLSRSEFRRLARQNMTGSAGQLRVAAGWLQDALIPVAPASEQIRILERLDELLSDLDAGVAELKAAQKKLVQYRQSLLKAAVEGALTAEWRAENTPGETGSDLLQRILTERRARWETRQLAKFQEQGKTPPKDWQKKYPEPVQPDTSGLPELPQGWVWMNLDQLSQFVRNGISKTPNKDLRGLPILRINAVRPMSVHIREVKHIEISEPEAREYFIDPGDLLATRYNGSVDLLGVFGLVRQTDSRILHPDKLIRIKPVLAGVICNWIEIAANTGSSRSYVVSRVKTTAGQTGISGEDLKKTIEANPP